MMHFAFPTVHTFVEKHNRYSNWEAAVQFAGTGGAQVADNPDLARRRWLKNLSRRLPLRPTLRFLHSYILRLGFLDGRAGYYFCRLLAMYEFLSVVAADFDLDGAPDLAVLGGGGTDVMILLGDGAGGFATGEPWGVGSDARSLAVADINLDGKPDLLLAYGNSVGSLVVLMGDGRGWFAKKLFRYAASRGVVPTNLNLPKPRMTRNTRSRYTHLRRFNGRGLFFAELCR